MITELSVSVVAQATTTAGKSVFHQVLMWRTASRG